MKVIVIGLGSMGRRRIRLLKQYNNEYDVYGIDSSEERRSQAEEEFGIKTAISLQTLEERSVAECAFVCTSPLSHAPLIRECLDIGLHVFSEINLHTTDYESNIELARRKNLVLFLSSTLLYRKEIQYIKEIIDKHEGAVSYQYHVGQYLPNWHPWESYKDFFVGKKETSGCREFMAIDFPWILSIFGKTISFHVMRKKTSELELPYDDTVFVTLEHEKAVGQVVVDVVSQKAVRNLEIFGEDIYLTWNGSPEGLRVYDARTDSEKNVRLYEMIDKRRDYNSSIIENAYLEEIINFFDVIYGKEMPRYSFLEDMNTIQLIDQIEGRV